MHSETICKTIHQYSSSPILQENMYKLQEIGKKTVRIGLAAHTKPDGDVFRYTGRYITNNV